MKSTTIIGELLIIVGLIGVVIFIENIALMAVCGVIFMVGFDFVIKDKIEEKIEEYERKRLSSEN